MKWLVAALALTALLIGAACNMHPEGARLDPALRLLVPKETKMLAAVQVEELIKSEFYQKHLKDRPLAMLDDFAKQTGIDPRKDLWEVMLVSDGEYSASLARGKFAPGDSEPRIPDQGGERFRYRSYTMVGSEVTAVLLMGSSMVGFGHTPLLKRIVDARSETNGPRGIIEERMKQIPYEADVWAVMSGSPGASLPLPGTSKDGKNTTVLAQAVNSIQSSAMYLDAGELLTMDVALHSDAEANAKQLESSAKGLLGLGLVMAPKLKDAMQAVKVTQEGKAVRLHVETGEATLLPLFQFLQ